MKRANMCVCTGRIVLNNKHFQQEKKTIEKDWFFYILYFNVEYKREMLYFTLNSTILQHLGVKQ